MTPRALIIVLVSAPVACTAMAGSILIPTTDRRDHVFDATRGLLYISTSSGTLERYDLASNTSLAPFAIGQELNGLDITPDAAFAYVAENLPSATHGFVRKVNLTNGTHADLTYARAGGETGVWDIKIGNAGKGLVSTRFGGSGSVPLRELDLATDVLSARSDPPGSSHGGGVRQRTHINRSADRTAFVLTESNLSSGPIFTYDAPADAFGRNVDTSEYLCDAMSAVNRDGSLITLELADGISILDVNLNDIDVLEGLSGGHVFDPVRDVLYAADTLTDELVALSTDTWREINRFPIGENAHASTPLDNGEMSIAPDGSLVAMSTPTGIRLIAVPEPTSGLLLSVAAVGLLRRRGR